MISGGSYPYNISWYDLQSNLLGSHDKSKLSPNNIPSLHPPIISILGYKTLIKIVSIRGF